MDERAFLREWVAYFGPVTAGRLIGWGALTALKLGNEEPTREALLKRGWGSVASRYRNVDHLQAFKRAMLDKGYVFEELGEETAAPIRLLRAVS